MILTALGSGYYHLSPGNARLVWDRLPMTLAFMGLLASVFSERVSARAGTALLAPLVALGIGSVLYWHWTEMAGAGDLRPYILVQFGSLFLVVLLLLLYSPRYHGTRYVVAGLLLYGVAKLAEIADRWMFEFSGMLSGHTLKHLAAAAAIGCLVIMLRERARVRGGGEIERHGSLNMA
jgi:hypothetical protein